jgi:hypothetical protein
MKAKKDELEFQIDPKFRRGIFGGGKKPGVEPRAWWKPTLFKRPMSPVSGWAKEWKEREAGDPTEFQVDPKFRKKERN